MQHDYFLILLNQKINTIMEEMDNQKKDEIYAKAVRAGRRTYFFDVKATRGNDYFIAITESKKQFNDDGTFRYVKHKIFLYKEDFQKFMEGLKDVTDFINKEQPYTPPPVAEQPEIESNSSASESNENEKSSFSDVNFEDLK